MRNCLNNFSTTDIHTLEYGLRRITEEQDMFSHKFYHRLLRNHPALKPWLRTMAPRSFGKYLIQCLDSIMREFRTYGEMITPPKNFWPKLSSTPVAPFEPSDMIGVAEIFIDLVANLHEDDWSPALEYTWRKTGKTVMIRLWETDQDPSNSSISFDFGTFLSNQEKERSRHQARRWHWAPIILVTGSIAALGFWRRCHLVKGKEPWCFSLGF